MSVRQSEQQPSRSTSNSNSKQRRMNSTQDVITFFNRYNTGEPIRELKDINPHTFLHFINTLLGTTGTKIHANMGATFVKFHLMNCIDESLRKVASRLGIPIQCLYITASDVLDNNEKAFISFLTFIAMNRTVFEAPPSDKAVSVKLTDFKHLVIDVTKATSTEEKDTSKETIQRIPKTSVTPPLTPHALNTPKPTSSRSTPVTPLSANGPQTPQNFSDEPATPPPLSPEPTTTNKKTSPRSEARTLPPIPKSSDFKKGSLISHRRKVTVRMSDAVISVETNSQVLKSRTYHPRKIFNGPMNLDLLPPSLRQNLEDVNAKLNFTPSNILDADFKTLQTLKLKFADVEIFNKLNEAIWKETLSQYDQVERRRLSSGLPENNEYLQNIFRGHLELANSIFLTNASQFSLAQISFLERFSSVMVQEESCFAMTIAAVFLTNPERIELEFNSPDKLPDFVGITHLLELASFCKDQAEPQQQKKDTPVQKQRTPDPTDDDAKKRAEEYRIRRHDSNESMKLSDQVSYLVGSSISGGLMSVSLPQISSFLDMLLLDKITDAELISLLVPVLALVDRFPSLSNILHERCKKSPALYNHVLWHCSVTDSKIQRSISVKILADQSMDPSSLKLFVSQNKLIENLTQIALQLKSNDKLNASSRDLDRLEKIARLRVVLNADSPSERLTGKFFPWKEIFSTSSPLILPCTLKPDTKELAASFAVTGFASRSATIFKSAQSPLMLPFITTDGREKRFIFKAGDDLRQDRNIILLMKTMDIVWKQHGYNFNIDSTLYEVIPTGATSGYLEMISKCHTLSSVDDIGQFFAKHKSANVEIYEKSLAAYCVSTFLLGIGDRHMDNLLVTEGGNFFHIDFGFVFGDDPKPLFTVAPMRVTKNMIAHLQNKETFYSYICIAFNIIRCYSTLLLNMVHLLFGQQATKYLLGNLRMDLDDDTAAIWIRSKVRESINSVLPSVNESIHKLAQKMRD